MDFKQSLPASLYEQVTTLHPHRFRGAAAAGADEVAIGRGWSLALDASCGPMTRLAADDLRQLMATTFGRRLAEHADGAGRVIAVRVAPAGRRPESYAVRASAAGVEVDAEDDEAGMRALFHLGQTMVNRQAPVLPRGRWRREPQWSLRITSPLLHRLRDAPGDYLDLPEAYLLNMARYGYNATYLYMDWFDFVSPAVSRDLARPGWRERLRTLQRAAVYLGRFGIRLLFHVNTLALPHDYRLFRNQPGMRGAQTWREGVHCLCSSSPAVLSLYRRAARQLFADVPALAGAVLIVGGECFLHCHTRPFPRREGTTNCPSCAKRPPEDLIAGVANTFAQGAREANARAQVMVWPYSAFSWGDLDAQKRLIGQLDPERTASLVTFEKDDWLSVEGTRSYVFDYSISQVGPSPRFRALDRAAQARGLTRLAKTESSTSIELFNVPRIPIMQQWAERFGRLRKQGLDGLHTNWRFYGFAAQRTDEVIDYFNWAPKPEARSLLSTMANRDFGAKAGPGVVKAWQAFSDAFALFPYAGGITGFPYFRGPFYLGPAHPFVFDLTEGIDLSERFWGPDPSMGEGGDEEVDDRLRRRPRFFIDATWTQPFGPKVMAGRLAELERKWAAGLEQLQRAGEGITRGRGREAWRQEMDLATVIGCMCRTAHHLARFQMLREGVVSQPCTPRRLVRVCREAIALLEVELANAETARAVARRDARLGYGATYGIAFDEAMIAEKIEHTREQISRAIPAFLSNYSFHIFGQTHLTV